MRILSLLFLFIVSNGWVSAQNTIWTQHNAVWHYDYWNVAESGFIKIVQDDPVLIGGHWCDHLIATKYSFFQTGPDGEMAYTTEGYIGGDVYASNDTVFYWDTDHFSVLYDFSAQAGDTWIVQNGASSWSEFSECNDTSYAVVESTGTVALGTEQAIHLMVRDSVGGAFGIQGPINSHFGAMGGNYLFPFYRYCGSAILEMDQITFKCFQDDSLYFNPSGSDCEYMLTHLGTNEAALQNITVYPNPATNVLFVTDLEPGTALFVTDASGNSVYQTTVSGEEALILLGNWSSGVYLLNAVSASGVANFRFVKQ